MDAGLGDGFVDCRVDFEEHSSSDRHKGLTLRPYSLAGEGGEPGGAPADDADERTAPKAFDAA